MLYIQKSDNLGSIASSLCLVHCVATPFLFVAQTCSAACCATAPGWWKAIDYVFLAVSFFAVFWSARNTSKNWMRFALWGAWVGLLLVVLNEVVNLVSLPREAIYVPSFGLITLHFYNKKYCRCKEGQCCAETN